MDLSTGAAFFPSAQPHPGLQPGKFQGAEASDAVEYPRKPPVMSVANWKMAQSKVLTGFPIKDIVIFQFVMSLCQH